MNKLFLMSPKQLKNQILNNNTFKKIADLLQNRFFLVNLLFLIGSFDFLNAIEFGKYSYGDIYDGRLNNFLLEHYYLALTNQIPSFVDANFYYPMPFIMNSTDNHWLLGNIYAILRIIGFSKESSLNGFVLFGTFTNYWVSYFVFRKFKFSANSSAIGAYIFAFNQIIQFKIGHMQLNFKAFIPLALLFSKNYFESLNLKYISYIILAITLQAISSFYMGAFLALLIFIIFILFLSQFNIKQYNKIFPKKFDLKISIPIFILSLFLLIIWSYPYFNFYLLSDQKKAIHLCSFFELRNLFNLNDLNWWNWVLNKLSLNFLQNNNSENQFFFGVGIWLVLLYYIIFSRSRNLQNHDKIFLKSFLIFFLLMYLDRYINGFYFLQIIFPPFGLLRAQTRFFYVIFFLVAYFITLILDKFPQSKTYHKFFKAIFCIIIIIEPFTEKISFSKKDDSFTQIDDYYQAIMKHGNHDSIVLFLSKNYKTNPQNLAILDNLNAMSLSQEKNIKVINIYSSINIYDYFINNKIEVNCKEAGIYIKKLEEKFTKVLRYDFKYDRDKLLVLVDRKPCSKDNFE